MTAVGGQPFRGSRPRPSILKGSIGELWYGETQVGVFYGWRITGADGDWKGEARKCELFFELPTRETRMRFFITQRSGGGDTLLELEGRGHALRADASRTGAVLEFKGTALTVV